MSAELLVPLGHANKFLSKLPNLSLTSHHSTFFFLVIVNLQLDLETREEKLIHKIWKLQ